MRTPVEAWEADETPLRPVDEEDLFWLLPSDVKPRKVYGFGVRFNNQNYFALDLLDRVDQELEVRYLPGVTSQIWLGLDDELICIAKRWDVQPPTVFRAAINHRDKEQERMEALLAKAGRSEQGPAADKEHAPDLSEELLRQVVAAVAADSNDRPADVEGEINGVVRQLAEQLSAAAEEDETAAGLRAAAAERKSASSEVPRRAKRSRYGDRVNKPIVTTRPAKEEQS